MRKFSQHIRAPGWAGGFAIGQVVGRLSRGSANGGGCRGCGPFPVASFAVALVAYTVVLPTFNTDETQPQLSSDDGIRLKGLEPHLILHRKRADGTEPLQNGALASAGDLIQIQYNGVSSAYGVILSMDGRGNVSCHLPEDCGDAARLDPAGGAVSLPFSIELDDAPSWERFYFVTSAEPFAANQVMMAVRAAADDGEHLDLPPRSTSSQSASTSGNNRSPAKDDRPLHHNRSPGHQLERGRCPPGGAPAPLRPGRRSEFRRR